jgi:hypothetical protein
MVPPRTSWLAVVAVTCALGYAGAEPPPLEITSPANKSAVHRGETVTVTVRANKAYRAVFLVGQNPIGVSNQVLRNPPYKLSIKIPFRIRRGVYTITAIGATATKHEEASKSIEVKVE